MKSLQIPKPSTWQKLTDGEQIQFCNVAMEFYKNVENPLHDLALSEYYNKDSEYRMAILITHDWRRLHTNLRMYRKNIDGANNSLLRYKAATNLLEVANFLSFVNSLLKK